MFRTEEWIRKVTYLLCRTNKQSVTASGGAEEGRTRIHPPSSSSSMEVAPGWDPQELLVGADMPQHREGRKRFPEQGVGLQH